MTNITKLLKTTMLVAGMLLASVTYAQQGIGTNNPNQDAALDIATTNKGLLIPRVALNNTTDPSPLSAHVAGMTVYNTNDNSDAINGVSPGYYVNDGTKWVKSADAAALDSAIEKLAEADSANKFWEKTLFPGEPGTKAIKLSKTHDGNERKINTHFIITDNGLVDIGGAVNVGGKTEIGGAITVTGAATMNGGLTLGSSSSTPKSDLIVHGKATINGATNISGLATMGSATINGLATMNNNADIKGKATIGSAEIGATTITGGATINTATITGNATIGNASIGATTIAGGATITSGGANITGSTTITGNAGVSGDLTLTSLGLTAADGDAFVIAEGGTGKLKRGSIASISTTTGIRTVTSTVGEKQISPTDGTILVDASKAAVTVTLPTAKGNEGKKYIIKKIDEGSVIATNTVTIAAAAQETIDGAASRSTSVPYQTFVIQSDGAAWWIIN